MRPGLDLSALRIAVLLAVLPWAAACNCGKIATSDSGVSDSGAADGGGGHDAGSSDGGASTDAGTSDGGVCGVCSGCCTGDVCHIGTDLSACGAGGVACVACNPTLADGCTAGSCTCGGGFACNTGQRCSAGACACDPNACQGCCNLFTNQCDPGNTQASCGTGGASCRACSAGQVCDAGSCLGTGCGPANCANGCCGSTGCVTPPTTTQCGASSSNCFDCAALVGPQGVPLADGCNVSGSCSCAGGPICAAGQECLASGCGCTSRSCPFGCCDVSGACVESSQQDNLRCGIGGSACHICANIDSCNDGVCGLCRFDSCDGGCCLGNGCAPSGFQHCGLPGRSCAACDPFISDRCSAQGTCDCGLGPACGAGLQCLGGKCTCTAESCAGCCAASAGGPITCVGGTTASQCGRYGAACQTCDPATQSCIDGTCVTF
jgi:hypothetical protein